METTKMIPKMVSSDEVVMQEAQIRKAQEKKEFESILHRLLRGEMEAPNEYVAFVVNQLRSIKEAGESVDLRLEQAQKAVREFRTERIRLAGIMDQYLLDLRRWLRPVEIIESKALEGVASNAELSANN